MGVGQLPTAISITMTDHTPQEQSLAYRLLRLLKLVLSVVALALAIWRGTPTP